VEPDLLSDAGRGGALRVHKARGLLGPLVALRRGRCRSGFQPKVTPRTDASASIGMAQRPLSGTLPWGSKNRSRLSLSCGRVIVVGWHRQKPGGSEFGIDGGHLVQILPVDRDLTSLSQFRPSRAPRHQRASAPAAPTGHAPVPSATARWKVGPPAQPFKPCDPKDPPKIEKDIALRTEKGYVEATDGAAASLKLDIRWTLRKITENSAARPPSAWKPAHDSAPGHA